MGCVSPKPHTSLNPILSSNFCATSSEIQITKCRNCLMPLTKIKHFCRKTPHLLTIETSTIFLRRVEKRL